MTDDFDDDAHHTSDGQARPNYNDRYQATASEIQSFVGRITTLDNEIAERREDKKEVYKELKARGFDKKAFDLALKTVRLAQDRAKVEDKLEVRSIASLYLDALGATDYEDIL